MDRRKPTIFGHCRTALDIESGRLSSLTTADEFHAHCRGAAARPGGAEPLLCACLCHVGKEVVPPPAEVQREVVTGKRDSKLLNQWATTLHQAGRLEVEVPADEKVRTSMMGRMRTAGRRAGLKVKIREKDGLLVAIPTAS